MDSLLKRIAGYKSTLLILISLVIYAIGAIGGLPIGSNIFKITGFYWQLGFGVFAIVLFVVGLLLLFQEARDILSIPVWGDKTNQIRIRLNSKRTLFTASYLELAEKASEVDVIGLTLKSFSLNISTQKIIELLKKGKEIKLLLLFPNAYVTQIRQLGEKPAINFSADIDMSLNNFELIYQTWLELRKQEQWKGSLEVRFYDTIPYFAYFRADDVFVLGFYYHHTSGFQSECLQIEETKHSKTASENSFITNLKLHFKAIWDENENNAYCRIGANGFLKKREEIYKKADVLKNQLMN